MLVSIILHFLQAALTGRGKPYILMAVVKQRSDARIAEFFREKLPLEISTAFKARHSTSPNSILYNTLLKICSKYKAISAYGESIFAYTVSTIVLLDVQAGSLTRVHFGTEAVPAVVLNSQGHACQPDSSQRHYIDSNFVHEESFSTLPGQHSVVLGSPGLWCAPTTLDHQSHSPACHLNRTAVPLNMSSSSVSMGLCTESLHKQVHQNSNV